MSTPPRLADQTSFAEFPAPAPTSTAPSIRDLEDGDHVDACLIIREVSRMSRRNGDDFLRIIVGDRSGTAEAVAWEEIDALQEVARPGAVVAIEGPFSVHPRYGAKITIRSLRTAQPGEYDAASLVPVSPTPFALLERDLRDLLETVQDPDLRRLLDQFFDPAAEFWQRFSVAPAAKYYHQAFTHGLLDHSLSVAQAVSAAAATFPEVNRDVAVTGALLHDIGKTEAYNDDPAAIDLTDAGRLQGEIPLGYFLVRSAIERIDGFDPEVAQAVLHIILSHHGALEHGSPVVPATREATLVHAMDNLGGKLGSFDRIEQELASGEVWSKFDRGISSAAYFQSRRAA